MRLLPLHANDLPQRVDDVHQVALGRHDRIDRLVGRRGFVQHALIFAAFDTARRVFVVGDPERAPCW